MAGLTIRGRLRLAHVIRFLPTILLLAVATIAHAQFEYTNIDGEIISYTTNNNAVTITALNGTNDSITFPDTIGGLPVTDIESVQPDGPTFLVDITIPNSVNDIGEAAFTQCVLLRNVSISKSVTNIEDFAFSFCTSLTNLAIPDSVVSIGDFAFSSCQSISNIVIPNSVLTLGDSAFANCFGATNVVIGTNIAEVGSSAFSACEALPRITFPNGVICIDSNAFQSCTSLTNASMDVNLRSIGDGAFEGCQALTTVAIPNGVTNIGSEAFSFCGFITISIPAGVLHIGDAAFESPFTVQAINVAASNPAYSSLGGTLYNKNQTILVEVPGTTTGSYSVISSVTNIEASAFEDCFLLDSVGISSNVIGMVNCKLSSCFDLTAITVDANNHAYESLSGVVFDKGQKTLVQFPGGFAGTYIIPNGVTNIADDAFFSSSIKNLDTNVNGVILPGSLLTIGREAFEDCDDLTNLSLPNSVINIGDEAFYQCFNLTNVEIPYGIADIGNYAFSACLSLARIDIPDSVTSLGTNAFSFCSDLQSCVIPGSLKHIPDNMFSGCSKLTNAIINDGVISIGSDAFDFTGLTSLNLPSSVTTIGEGAFSDTALSYVTIPSSVTNMGDAFAFNPDLTSIYFLGNPPNLDFIGFLGDSATVYYLPWTTGWGPSYGGVPAAPGSQQLVTGAACVQTNNFGFTMVWSGNPTVVVQACTNLANPVWLPISTNTLANGVAGFRDPHWVNYPNRYYRLSSPSL